MVQAPMDAGTFFGTFRAYHEAFPAAPFIWLALALTVIWLATRFAGRADRMIALFLAAVWAWAGIAYLIVSHGPANPAGYVFGGLFVVQALLFLHLGVVRHRLAFEPRRDAFGAAGAILMGYAILIYPIVGAFLGHAWPDAPTFGVPCPVTIFTFGLLLWTAGRVPSWALAIPVAWGLIGASAALSWGVWQDIVMPIAAVAASAMILARNRQRPLSSEEAARREEMAALAGVG